MTAKQKANRERFKKVVAEAKKLRKKNPKLTQAQAVKQAWAIMYSKKRAGVGAVKKKSAKKKAAPKKSSNYHKDTKSHNVNIRVMSGMGTYENPDKILYEIEFWQKQLDKLRAEYKSEKGKMYKHSITQDIRLAKKWLELNKQKLKKYITKIK